MEKHLKHKNSLPFTKLKTEQSGKVPSLPKAQRESLILKLNSQRQQPQYYHEDAHWNFMENRRENHLNTLFNRRKTVLETISRKNRDIYQRIVNQESHYSQQKIQPYPKKDKNMLLQTLNKGSKMLLTLSRNAMIHSKLHNEPHHQVQKQNNQENLTSLGSKQLSKTNDNHLDTVVEEGKMKVVESRLVSNFTTRMLTSNSQQICRPRGYSLCRKKLQDLVVNF